VVGAELQKLFGGIKYEVVNAEPWWDGNHSELIGVVLDLKLGSPLSTDAVLPTVQFSPPDSTLTELPGNMHSHVPTD
jgi:hypothetical protein